MIQTVVGEYRPLSIKIDGDALKFFTLTRDAIVSTSTLVWAEHCSECVMPTCYSTCAFYTPRRDLKCRRFANGAQPVRALGEKQTLGFRVSFRKWGKLELASRAAALSPTRAATLRKADNAIARLLSTIPLPHSLQDLVTIAWNRVKTRLASSGLAAAAFDAFLIECLSETSRDCVFTLTVKPAVSTGRYFQKHFTLRKGYNRIEVAVADIRSAVDLDAPVLVQIEPVAPPQENSFIFSCLEFVAFAKDHARHPVPIAPVSRADAIAASAPSAAAQPAAKVKCVVWDLDNTLWRGTLIEDGVDNLTLNDVAVKAIKELDQRGVLHSVASKNNPDEALAALERFGLRDYFLAPQIGWGPKSASISEIARRLNIHKNTFLFVDDQKFERAEVVSAHPDMRVAEETQIGELLKLPEFDLPITEEGCKRRVMYRVEEAREAAFKETNATFVEFLKSCSIELTVQNLTRANISRVFELSQRTNQLNYAGKPSSRSDVEQLLSPITNGKRGFVLSCSDKFGDYGVIGFAIVDVDRFHVENFYMSCRVQHKKVDHAFFAWLIGRAIERGYDRVSAKFHFSGRNQSARQVLQEMKFFPSSDNDVYCSPRLDDLPERNVVKLIDRTGSEFEELSSGATAD